MGINTCIGYIRELVYFNFKIKMVIPTFGDLGKKAKDVFSKDYNYGSYKLSVNSKTKTGQEFKAEGAQCHETMQASGSIESIHKTDNKYNVELKEKWFTDNKLESTISSKGFPCANSKLIATMTLRPLMQPDKKIFKLTSECNGAWKGVEFNSKKVTQYTLAPEKTALNCVVSGMVGHKGYLMGGEWDLNLLKKECSKATLGFGYLGDGFQVNSSVVNGDMFSAGIYHQISSDVELGYGLSWAKTTSQTQFKVGACKSLDADTKVKVMVNNESRIGLAYTQKIRQGVDLTISTNIDAANFNSGRHSAGLGLAIDL